MRKVVLPLTAFLLLGCLCQLAFAQKQTGCFEIGDKKIQFDIVEQVEVKRTITDTLISCSGVQPNNFRLGAYTKILLIPISERKMFHREVFNEAGCIWTRVTNDEFSGYMQSFMETTFHHDSFNLFKRPSACFRYDTIMQINPITLEEQLLVETDSTVRTKYNLQSVSRKNLMDALTQQFSLAKSNANLRIQYLWLNFFNTKCGAIEVNYRRADYMRSVLERLNTIPAGTVFVIERLKFEDVGGKAIEKHVWDLATFTLVD